MNLKELKKLLIVGWLGLLAFSSQAYVLKDSVTVLQPEQKHSMEIGLTMDILSRYHYLKIDMNDSLSAVIFDNYLSALDDNKAYFTKSDVDYFSKYKYRLDDDLKERNVDVAFQIFRIFRERAETRITYIQTLIDGGFDFSKEESIELSNDELPWAMSEAEINERWRKIIKSQALNLKLSGKDDDGIKETLTKRYQRYQKGINQYNSDDVFQFFMNAVAETYDPHTNYFSPISSENFNINMNLSLEGIGARLTQSMDYTVINEVIAGGPAFKSKQLHKDDKIIGVAQGDEEYVDVIGWRLQDVVQLIRGPKGSVVRLQYLKGDDEAIVNEVKIIREKINLEDESAKAEMIPISKGNKVYNLGVITIPNFYMNFEDARNGVPDYRSVSRDVQKLIADLQTKNVDGIMIDLRYNGGGALPEAINLTGLFIDKGPVVQVKHSNGEIDVQKNTNGGVFYDGPLAVLVNRFSASASEIFSAAIQDYHRGVIIGETTFGKGTVQQMAGFNRYYPNYPEKMGNLKFTLSKYYRVSGSSTQNIGVTPDVEFPSAFDASEFGESSRPNSLKWDQIISSYYKPTNNVNKDIVGHLNTLFQNDLKTDVDLKNLQKDIAKMKANQDRKELSLNLEERKQEQDKDTEESDKQKKLSESAGRIYQEYTTTEEDQEKLREDPYLKEGLRLLAELVK
ncbi:carboxy terminal-processing peptidase [Reichenbachiella carrageenanivorans]|uniref:Carboxy terminal-processing peptidase n=1 Tax=Reichenbachiella carrageenanivorans TaxID=2979869 RepID=A0ABY6CXR1_9BACT|nr:carboxy terminal-processing peptidase [Reichenbachiella carrageenanivorans]UXX78165.1 carboxy terminal-processing peptidase [Reichenbachiella carrageenanivorans]